MLESILLQIFIHVTQDLIGSDNSSIGNCIFYITEKK